jgi:hypothetical protein
MANHFFIVPAVKIGANRFGQFFGPFRVQVRKSEKLDLGGARQEIRPSGAHAARAHDRHPDLTHFAP